MNKKNPSPARRPPKFPEITDERVVLRPRNSFIQFALNRMDSGDFKNIHATDRMKLIGQEWKALSEDEKSVRYHPPDVYFEQLLTHCLDRNTSSWLSKTASVTSRNTRTPTAMSQKLASEAPPLSLLPKRLELVKCTILYNRPCSMGPGEGAMT